MSIKSRIHEAEAFWKEGRKEKSLLAALSAASDTAKRRYAAAQSGEALARFIADAAGQLAEGGVEPFDWAFRGGVSLGEVLHDVYRSLLDTGRLPADVELVPSQQFQVHVLDGNRRGYSDGLIPVLIEIVKRAPENRREFPKGK